MTGLAVATRGLVHVYRTEGQDVAALAGVDLAIRPGETVGLLGPSGSGKSTLLALLGGLMRPSAGRITVGGRDLVDLTEAELDDYRAGEAGVLLQGARRNLVPYLSAADNVVFAQAAALRRGRSCPDVLDTLALVGADQFATRRPADLSPGQAQLIALAVALAAGPGLLLADEPSSALSHAARDDVLAAIDHVNRERSATVVVVTHDEAVARRMRRTVTIRDGRVGGEGRDGEEFAIVAADGSLPLPVGALADLPPGTAVRVHREGARWLLVPDGLPGASGAAGDGTPGGAGDGTPGGVRP
ncbi:MAG: ATP-binding cassette domain-containing protein [Austwickia sp.]|nr:MAG: ATP-binding cassette domain-containing protein [Austwickia sp.]